ncbi:universal stress protein [Mucilaginibacter ximonensis]|uniref:Universal stress protein n=1 Tax=Mucilaginibacter ximonensis TaxID=538021 RepID=A0ABW5YFW8_9SPHI
MKTILVLTDFSINAEYVAYYALHMAQHFQTNLLVCNVFEDDKNENGSINSSHPYSRAEEESIQDLGAVVAALKTSIDKQPRSNSFRPDISQCSEVGTVDKKLNELALKHDVLLAVISSHSANNLSGSFKRNHARAIVEKANMPILIVPYQVRFKPFGVIAFASGMNNGDIKILNSLTGLARFSDATVVVVHVSAEDQGNKDESALELFFTQNAGKTNYATTQYRHICGRNVADSLKELTVHIDVDLLALVHRRRSSLQQLFNGVVRKMLNSPSKPLLISPGSV